jgi:hypothetical protein
MSVKLMVAVFDDCDLTPSETLVGLALADCANDDGECYPGQRKLTEKTRLSRRGVQRALDGLETKGRIDRFHRCIEKGDRAGRRTSDGYMLHFGLSVTMTPGLSVTLSNFRRHHDAAIKRKGNLEKIATSKVVVVEEWERDLEALGCKRTS